MPVPPAYFIDKEIIQKDCYNYRGDGRAGKRKEVPGMRLMKIRSPAESLHTFPNMKLNFEKVLCFY